MATRSSLLALALLLPLSASAQTVRPDQTFVVEGQHDGVHATAYRLMVQLGPDVPASALVGGTIAFPPSSLTFGAGGARLFALAVGADGESISEPLNLTITVLPDPAPPTPQPCPYVSPQGVASPKAIGNDDVRGWNFVNFGNVEDLRRHYARMNQLKSWGMDPQVLGIDPVLNRVFIYAPCLGYLPPSS